VDMGDSGNVGGGSEPRVWPAGLQRSGGVRRERWDWCGRKIGNQEYTVW
jgi:hypothetical protein